MMSSYIHSNFFIIIQKNIYFFFVALLFEMDYNHYLLKLLFWIFDHFLFDFFLHKELTIESNPETQTMWNLQSSSG